MNSFINGLNKIFSQYVTYKTINLFNKKKLRQKYINLVDLIFYQFQYSLLNTTKSSIITNINIHNNTNIYGTSYYRKQLNISIDWYNNLFLNISKLCDIHIESINKNSSNVKIIAIDGTNTNNINQKVSLSIGLFDVNDKIPVDFCYERIQNRNKEVKCSIEYIKQNLNIFKKSIIVADRFYFSYQFINFLIDNNIKLIIRSKNNATFEKNKSYQKL